jgi:hypothetical protein
MADMTEVADVLVGVIAAIVYPNGTDRPSPSGVNAKVYQGWPEPAKLQADLPTHLAHVSIFPGAERITTRRFPEWQQMSAPAPTLTVAVAGTSITIGGTVTVPQAVALIIDGQDFAYGVQATDTLDAIAAALAAQVSAVQAASAAGPVLTIPGAHRLVARTVANGISAKEVAREQRPFKVSIWAGCYDDREPLAKLIGPALAALVRLDLPDGTTADVTYAGSLQIDDEQRQGIYRRDITLSIEFPTIVTRVDNQVAIVQTNLSAQVLDTSVPIKTINQ